MRIGLLNLQYDTNYGGNIQRYALMTVLQRLGHDVTHLNLRFNFNEAPLYRRTLRLCKRLVMKSIGRLEVPVLKEYRQQHRYEQECVLTDAFYNRYIKHTPCISSVNQLSKYTDFDAFVVGSDQVWRKTIADYYGIATYFFDYLPLNCKAKRVAYGVSLGTSENELSKEEIERLAPLYARFSAVSVREDSGVKLLMEYGWINPTPHLVLDPTLLLTKNDYITLINDGVAHPSEGNMFCYILDPSAEKSLLIHEYEHMKKLKQFIVGDKENKVPIQQWIRSFYDSEYVVTDSFHGMVFCLIFNKPFKLIHNKFRGNSRFESIMRELQIPEDTEQIDWNLTNSLIEQKRKYAIDFLKSALA